MAYFGYYTQNFIHPLPNQNGIWMIYGVILVRKAINLSFKAIKTIEGPDIGQLSKVRRRM